MIRMLAFLMAATTLLVAGEVCDAGISRQLNLELAYGVKATPAIVFADFVPAGSADRWFVESFEKNLLLLQKAGWEQATQVMVSPESIVCKRFGRGDVIYFTLYNTASDPLDCEVRIDLAALKMSPKSGEMCFVREVARKAKISEVTEGDVSVVKLRLEPDQTHILKLQRTW